MLQSGRNLLAVSASNQAMGKFNNSSLRRSIFLLLVVTALAHADGLFEGEWRTSVGTLNLKQTKNEVTGAYGKDGAFTIKGTAAGRKLSFEYQEASLAGDGQWTL